MVDLGAILIAKSHLVEVTSGSTVGGAITELTTQQIKIKC